MILNVNANERPDIGEIFISNRSRRKRKKKHRWNKLEYKFKKKKIVIKKYY